MLESAFQEAALAVCSWQEVISVAEWIFCLFLLVGSFLCSFFPPSFLCILTLHFTLVFLFSPGSFSVRSPSLFPPSFPCKEIALSVTADFWNVWRKSFPPFSYWLCSTLLIQNAEWMSVQKVDLSLRTTMGRIQIASILYSIKYIFIMMCFFISIWGSMLIPSSDAYIRFISTNSTVTLLFI